MMIIGDDDDNDDGSYIESNADDDIDMVPSKDC